VIQTNGLTQWDRLYYTAQILFAAIGAWKQGDDATARDIVAALAVRLQRQFPDPPTERDIERAWKWLQKTK